MATKTLAQDYENRGIVRTNLLYDPANGNAEIIEPGIGGRVLFKNGEFTDFGKQIYSDSEQKTVTQRMQNDLRAAQKKINNAKLQPWAQSQSNVDAAADTEVNGNVVGGIEQFAPGTFGRDKKFENLKYPKTMNSGQDRIFITQFQYSRTNILQEESDFAALRKAAENIVGYVTLPMPNDITETNSVGWGEDSLSNVAAMLMPGAVSAVKQTADGNIFGALNTGADLLKSTISDPGLSERIKQLLPVKAAASVVQKFGVNVNPEAFITRATGAAINPNLELLFNGPKLRQFGFQFKMSPRSEDEAKEIRTILRFFKQGMAPRKSEQENASFFLGTPNVFKIEFKSGNSELKSIGKIKTCALVSFSVNYTPDGFYAAYKDSVAGGSQPVAVTMQLGFTELTPVFNNEFDDNQDDIGPNKIVDRTPLTDGTPTTPTSTETSNTRSQGGQRRGAAPQGQLGGIDPNSTNQLRGRAR